MGTALTTPSRTTNCEAQDEDPTVVQMTSVDSFSSAPAPTTVQWEQHHGGHVVFVTGAWDNWRSKTPLTRANPADPFVAVLSMPVGVHQYKYIVDGNWMHNPLAPTQTDQHGNLNNIVEVTVHKPEFDDDDDANDDGENQNFSPPASFDYSVISQDDVRGEPPEVPIFLGVPPPSGERKSAPTHNISAILLL